MDNLMVAFAAAAVYWVVFVCDESLSWQTFVRPIIVGPIMGLVLGDLATGCIMGASFEAIYLGIISAGGGTPADAYSATIICTTFVISGGLSQEAAIALAIPVGTIMSMISRLIVPIHAIPISYFEKWAKEGNTKAYCRLQQTYRFIIPRTIQTIVVFVAVFAGSDAIVALFDMLPEFVLNGLQVAGNIMPALGLGILLSMTFKAKYVAWLFIGFALSAYAGLSTIAIAVLSGCAAVLTFFQDSELKERLSGLSAASSTAAADDSEEDFFA